MFPNLFEMSVIAISNDQDWVAPITNFFAIVNPSAEIKMEEKVEKTA